MKIIYGVLVVLICLFGLLILLGELLSGEVGTALLALIFAPIGTLLYLVDHGAAAGRSRRTGAPPPQS